MKWSLQQLFKYNRQPFEFETTYDFHNDIKNIDDIIDIKETHVVGYGQNVYQDKYQFHLHITTVLILEDARTLEPVDYQLDIEVDEVFDTDLSDEDTRVIEKNTIDLRPVVWENIILEKPIRFVKDDNQNN